MKRWANGWMKWTLRFLLLVGACLGQGAALLADTTQVARSVATDETWRKSIDLITHGSFDAAASALNQATNGAILSDQLRGWLRDYKTKQEARVESDRVEFEQYVGYAKARVERKEWVLALDKAWLASDVAQNREEFLKTDWVQQLIQNSITYASECRQRDDWQGAWEVYVRLTALYEREPRYEKLEREAGTHLRLETMFREGSTWQERLERVRWEDAEESLEYIAAYYVEPPDFKKITELGLEQLILLADSKAAQTTFDALKDEDNRADFRSRLQAWLDHVRSSPTMDGKGCAQIFRRVVRDINKQTVQLPEELIVSELMRGALEPLDEFTSILWPKETEDFDKHTRGNFIGVGIQIVKNRANEIEVVTPLDDTPAYRAGIQAGDIIKTVNGEELRDVSLNKVVETITGPKGTMVNLTVRRDGKEIPFTLERTEVKIQSVKGQVRDRESQKWNYWLDRDNGIAYIRVTNFQKNTVEDVDGVLKDLKSQGLKGLVFDLRGNPGGLLESAWQMASLFLRRDQNIVSTKGRIAEENRDFETKTDGPHANLPLVVLTDESSASASEIVSGAIRDHNRGIVVGSRTFGKFSVQNLISLSHSRAKLKITTASYYLPSGVSLHRTPSSEKWGVDPTIPVRLVRWERQNLWQMRREADLLGPVPAKSTGISTSDDVPDDPETAGPIDGAESTKSDDNDKPSDDPAFGPPPLPMLVQKDENRRPKEDPQLDTALLVLRATLLGRSSPTVAAVETEASKSMAQP
ncbi:MAG: S41 family peptidase [Planctomycetota bacterium]